MSDSAGRGSGGSWWRWSPSDQSYWPSRHCSGEVTDVVGRPCLVPAGCCLAEPPEVTTAMMIAAAIIAATMPSRTAPPRREIGRGSPRALGAELVLGLLPRARLPPAAVAPRRPGRSGHPSFLFSSGTASRRPSPDRSCARDHQRRKRRRQAGRRRGSQATNRTPPGRSPARSPVPTRGRCPRSANGVNLLGQRVRQLPEQVVAHRRALRPGEHAAGVSASSASSARRRTASRSIESMPAISS